MPAPPAYASRVSASGKKKDPRHDDVPKVLPLKCATGARARDVDRAARSRGPATPHRKRETIAPAGLGSSRRQGDFGGAAA
jgi:hypothetical protein